MNSWHRPWTRRHDREQPSVRHEHGLLTMIGNTPMVRLNRLTSELPDSVELWAKLEFMNPGGSIKDRPARRIIEQALLRGDLGDGKTLIDATSGNTGIAYAMIGAALGVDVELVMPANVAPQRRHIVETFGARCVFSSEMEGSDGAIRLAQERAQAEPDRYFYANQYGNEDNPKAHELTTAPEIWEQTEGRVTHFVACTGTAGTIMGAARGLKRRNKAIQIIGAQPSDAFHGLEGLKHMPSAIVPDIYDESRLDDLLWVETEAGWEMAEALAKQEGIAAGNSAGANVWAALQVARGLERGVVVTVICDHADRYVDD